MDFELNDEQRSFRDSVRSFARSQLAPDYLPRSKSAEFPWEAHRQVAELGVLGLLAGAEWSGVEPDFLAAGVAIEELAYADFNVANCAIPVMITTSIITQHAEPAIRDRWLPPLISGEKLVALGLTEPDVGSDAGALRTTAVATSDGWRITGEKTSITAVPHAAGCIVFARISGQRGVSAFFVDLTAPGIEMGLIPDSGWLPVGRGTISLADVEVPREALIGVEGGGFHTVMNNFDFTRPLLALTGIGTAQACLDETAAYVRERHAFGAPLAKFEGISFPLAEHATYLEAARLLSYKALSARDAGRPHTTEAAMSKWLGPFSATRAVHDCLLMHGHYGYSTESPFEQRLRDVMAVELADGTAQVQKIIIARELYGREFVPYSR